MADASSSLTPHGSAPLAVPRTPAIGLPDGACDAHCHIFGPFDRFPLPADRSFTPHETPERDLRKLHDHLGIARAVIVQSQGHGFDHAPLLAALATGAGRYRGVALVRPETPADVLRHYAEAGICGARFSFMPHLGYPDLDAVRTVISRVAPLGWHIAIHVAGRGLEEMEAFIRTIPAPVIIDHMARPDIAEGPDGPVARTLLRLLETGRVSVKISGAERLSKQGAPYADVEALMHRLIGAAPERILWGTDWPHVNLSGPMPDEGDLLDLLGRVTTPEHRKAILVDNPQAIFGFPPLSA